MDGRFSPRPRNTIFLLLLLAVCSSQLAEGLGRGRRPPPPGGLPPHLRRGGSPYPIQHGDQISQGGPQGIPMQQGPHPNHAQHGQGMPQQGMPQQQQQQQMPHGPPGQGQFAHRRIQFGPPPPKFRGKHPFALRRPPPPHLRPQFPRGPPQQHMNPHIPSSAPRLPQGVQAPVQAEFPLPPSQQPSLDPLNPSGLKIPLPSGQIHTLQTIPSANPNQPQIFSTQSSGLSGPIGAFSSNDRVVIKYAPPYGPFGNAPKQVSYQPPAPGTIIHANIEKGSQEAPDQPKIIQVHLPQPRPGQHMPSQNIVQIHITSTPRPPSSESKDFATGSTFKPPVDIITKDDFLPAKPLYGPPPEYPNTEYRPSESKPLVQELPPRGDRDRPIESHRQDHLQRRPDDHYEPPNSFEVRDKHYEEENGKSAYGQHDEPPRRPIGSHYNRNDQFRPDFEGERGYQPNNSNNNKWNNKDDEEHRDRDRDDYRQSEPDFNPPEPEYEGGRHRDRDHHHDEEDRVDRDRDYHRERDDDRHHHHDTERIGNREPEHEQRNPNRDEEYLREPSDRHEEPSRNPEEPPRHHEEGHRLAPQEGFDYKSSGSQFRPDYYGPPTPEVPPVKKLWDERPLKEKVVDEKYSQPDPLYHEIGDVKNSAELHYQAPPTRFDNSFSNDFQKKDLKEKKPFESEKPKPLIAGTHPTPEEVLTALGLDASPPTPVKQEKIVNFGHYKPYNLMDYIRSQLKDKEHVGKDKEALFSRHGELPPHSEEGPFRPPGHHDEPQHRPHHDEHRVHHDGPLFKPPHADDSYKAPSGIDRSSGNHRVGTHYNGPSKIKEYGGPPPHLEAPDRIGHHHPEASASHEYSTVADSYFPKSEGRHGYPQHGNSYGPPRPQGHSGPHFDEGNRRGGSNYGPPVTPSPYSDAYPVYVTEPEPIIEIIVQDSNVTLPPPPPLPPTTPPPPPTAEPVHVFYVQYSANNKSHPHVIPAGAYSNRGGILGTSYAPINEPEINLERPIASVPIRQPDQYTAGNNPAQQQQQFLGQNANQQPQHHQQHSQQQHQHFHQQAQQSQQQPQHIPQQQQPQQQYVQQEVNQPYASTTLRTVIRPDTKEHASQGLGVTFDHPPNQEVLLQNHLQQVYQQQQQQQAQQVPQQQQQQQNYIQGPLNAPAQNVQQQQPQYQQPQQVPQQQVPQQQQTQIFYQPPQPVPQQQQPVQQQQQPQQQLLPHPSASDFSNVILAQTQGQQQQPIAMNRQAPLTNLPTPLIAYPYGSPQQQQQQPQAQQPQQQAPQQQQQFSQDPSAAATPNQFQYLQQPQQQQQFVNPSAAPFTVTPAPQYSQQPQFAQAQNVPQYAPNPQYPQQQQIQQNPGFNPGFPQQQNPFAHNQFLQKTLQTPKDPDMVNEPTWTQWSQNIANQQQQQQPENQYSANDRSDQLTAEAQQTQTNFQQRTDQQTFQFQQPFHPSPQVSASMETMMAPDHTDFVAPFSNMPINQQTMFDPNPRPFDPPVPPPSLGEPMSMSDMPKRRPQVYDNIGMRPPSAGPVYPGMGGMAGGDMTFSKRMGIQELASLLDTGNSGQESQGQTSSGSQERSSVAEQSETSQNQQTYEQSVFQLQPSYAGSAQQLANTQFSQQANTQTQPRASQKLPEDVPEDIKQQLMNSGILGNADIQVINFDENLFKELGDLPPEALTALSQQSGSLGLSASNIQMAEHSQGSSEKLPSTSSVWNGGSASLLGENAGNLASILGKRSVRDLLVVRNNKPRPKRGRGANRRNLILFVTDKDDVLLYNIKKNQLTRVGDTHKPILSRALELSHHKFNLQVAE